MTLHLFVDYFSPRKRRALILTGRTDRLAR
jgi:hypothetical protein